MASPPSVRLHAAIYGIVQGVNFRYYTSRRAAELGVAGWVRNRRDGAVEITAEGPKPKLEAFLGWLQNGPPSAHVARVEAEWEAATGEFTGFHIQRS
jgi:acylphosphatase